MSNFDTASDHCAILSPILCLRSGRRKSMGLVLYLLEFSESVVQTPGFFFSLTQLNKHNYAVECSIVISVGLLTISVPLHIVSADGFHSGVI